MISYNSTVVRSPEFNDTSQGGALPRLPAVIDPDPATLGNVLEQNQSPILVTFYKPTCGPCRIITPLLEEIAKELGDKILVVKLSVAEEAGLAVAGQYNVNAVPTLIAFLSGKEAFRTGLTTKAALLKRLNDLKPT